jgi:proline racemase
MRLKKSIHVIDYHACGEPLRIVPSSPHIPGATMVEKFKYVQTHLNGLRCFLTHEPRGHRKMFGCLLTEPVNPGSLFGVLFFDTTIFNAACGHGSIALATAAIEQGWFDAREGLNTLYFDIPLGQVELVVEVKNGEVEHVRYRNVPCFVFEPGIELDTSAGPISADVVFGGVFFAIVETRQLAEISPERLPKLYLEIKDKLDGTGRYFHPDFPSIRDIDGVHFISEEVAVPFVKAWRASSFYSGGALDRSPCGTGTCATMALYHYRGELSVNAEVKATGPTGEFFTGQILGVGSAAGLEAILP